jgi:hypothetical protein
MGHIGSDNSPIPAKCLVRHCNAVLAPGNRFSTRLVLCWTNFFMAPDSSVDIKRYIDGSLAEESFTRSGIFRIHQAKLGPGGPSTHANVNGYVVKIAVYSLIQDTIANLDNPSRNLALEAPRHECSFWIPAVILMSVLPKLVQ